MNTLLAVFWGLAGLFIGSFVNVVVDRLPKGRSLVRPRSHCEVCKEPIADLDLVPVLNYLWLRGRCRYCRAPISKRLPLVELLGGLLFAYVGYRWGYSAEAFLAAFSVAVLLATLFIDLEHQLILDRITLPAAVVALAAAPFGPPGASAGVLWSYVQALAGVGVGMGALLAIYLVSWRLLGQPGIGEGDVKFAGLMGALLGWRLVAVALPLAFIAAGLVGIALLALRIRGRKAAIPFGPFLSAATLATLFAGNAIRDWYLGLIGV